MTERDLGRNQKELPKESTQPACEAGGQSASPRRWPSRAWETQPQCVRAHGGRHMKRYSSIVMTLQMYATKPIGRQLRRLSLVLAVTPGSASASPGAITLSASSAGWLDVVFLL